MIRIGFTGKVISTFELERGMGISHIDTWQQKLSRQWEQPVKKTLRWKTAWDL